jgi:FkbM family methyltransferase
MKGRICLANFLVRHPASFTYRDTLGFTRRTKLDDVLDACWFLGVDWCLLPQEVVEQIPAHATVVDAGANIGIVTEQLCRAVGSRGMVHAVEPLPANARRLQELKSDNRLDQLAIWECALSDTAGTADLRTQVANGVTSAHASLTASWIAEGTVGVATRPLDELVPESQRVSFIKLDVEGAESPTLEGAERIMTYDRPLVYCEFNDIVLRDAGYSSDDLLRKFADLGYAVAAEYPQSDAIKDRLLAPA